MISFFQNREKDYNVKGSALVEIVVVASILAVVAVAVLGSFSILSRLHERNMMAIKGELLAEEGVEIVRFVKTTGWNNLSSIANGQDRYFALATSSWSFTSVPETVDGVFIRSFKLHPVYRDASDDILPQGQAGGTLDSDTLLTEVFVSWSWRNATTTVTYKSYVTNI